MRRLVECMHRDGADRAAILARLKEEIPFLQHAAPFQMAFRGLVADDPNVTGRVLDIGCGPQLTGPMRWLESVTHHLDGVDPIEEEVNRHPTLKLRWSGEFEKAPIPEGAYDLALAYNVIEHVAVARPFFEKLARVLRPGGTFWALSPNANHPFAWMSRTLEVLGVKKIMARNNPSNVNSYSAYYRLNCRRHINKAIRDLGFEEPRMHYFARPGWALGYFPRGLQWAPELYDAAIADRIPPLRLLIVVQLKKLS